jgi:hypothetical protein
MTLLTLGDVETDPYGNANLVDIIGRKEHYPDTRVVSFGIHEGQLIITEECDQFFGLTFTVEELDNLIAWLTDRRNELHPD